MCATNRGSASGSWQMRRGINAARNVFQSKTVHRQISRMKPGGLGGDLGRTEAEGVVPDGTGGKRAMRLTLRSGGFAGCVA